MSDQVPREVLGLVVFVNLISFLAVFLGLLLVFMLWRHGEGLSCTFHLLVFIYLRASRY